MTDLNVCTTAACVKAAEALLSYMAPNYTSIDPCSNWDVFMCQGYRDTHKPRPDQVGVGIADDMDDFAVDILREIMEGPYPGESNHSSFSPRNLISVRASVDETNFNTMKTFYDSCMNETTLKSLGTAPLVALLEDLQKIFPVDESTYGDSLGPNITVEDTKSMRETLLWFEKLGLGSFLSFGPGTDDKNPEDIILWVSPPGGQSLPSRDNYDDPKLVQDYKDVIVQVLSAVLPSKAAQKAARVLADQILDFETKVVKSLPPVAEMREPAKYYTPMSLANTTALAPVLDLEHVLKNLVPSNYTINYMITSFPEYLTNLESIFEATPKAGLQAYFMWYVIRGYRSYAIADELLPIRRFSRILNGQDPDAETDRWRTCESQTSGSLAWITGRFFVEKAFSEKAKTYGDQIIKDLQAEFVRHFKTSSWMDDTTRERAIEKISKVNPKIGYPTKSPNIMDPQSVRDWYASLTITPSYFSNGLALSAFSANRTWSRLGQPVNHDDWGMAPQDVNAYYNPSENEIVFPAAIMQLPLFDVELPNYVNYGAFGAIVGHEMSHGFDMTGRQFDANGVLTDWWTNTTSEEFDKRAQCFVAQYDNFTITTADGKVQHGNGELALGENIADSGGLEIAYGAWKAKERSQPDAKLPGLEKFSNDQLFFMFKTPFFCGAYTTEYLIRLMQTDPHPPPSYRTVAPLLNSREFREAFNCPSKQPTCELW